MLSAVGESVISQRLERVYLETINKNEWRVVMEVNISFFAAGLNKSDNTPGHRYILESVVFHEAER